jgi:hypothetical protein
MSRHPAHSLAIRKYNDSRIASPWRTATYEAPQLTMCLCLLGNFVCVIEKLVASSVSSGESFNMVKGW